MNTKKQTFVNAFNSMNGYYLDDIKQLQSMKFDQTNMDELIDLCEAYHSDKKDQELLIEVSNQQIDDLTTSLFKWTNPAYLMYKFLEFVIVFVYSLFITSKDFKK